MRFSHPYLDLSFAPYPAGRFLARAARLVVLGLLSLILAACGDDDLPDPSMTLAPDGLEGRTITRFYADGEALLAAADTGVYRKASLRDCWEPLGPTNHKILDLAVLGSGHYLASTEQQSDEDTLVYWLMETTDGGTSWTSIDHNFGGDDGQEAIQGLHYDADNNALYATGVEALAASYDEGRSWTLLSGIWHGFGQPKTIVKRNPATNEIWYGGQNAMEQLVLRVYSLDTEEERSYSDLMPNPSVVYGIQFHPTNGQQVLISGEGGIVESRDNGATWDTLIGDVDHRFYFDVALDPTNPNRLYSGGWDKIWDEPQALIFEVSDDAGQTWNRYLYPDPYLFGGVRSMIAVTQEGKTRVYLGLYRGGIMRLNVYKQ